MDSDKDRLKEIVAKIMSEIEEGDLLVRKEDNMTWEQMSTELRNEVDKLIDSISRDDYQKALEHISAISYTMKVWKRRIVMGSQSRKSGEEYNLGRFSFERLNESSVEEK